MDANREKGRDAADLFFQRQPQYTMQGVVNFLASMSRSQDEAASEWAKERKILENKLQDLEHQCRTHERIESELVERIKILEYALRQERLARNVRGSLSSSLQSTNRSDRTGFDNHAETVVMRSAGDDENYLESLFLDESPEANEDLAQADKHTWEWNTYAVLRSHLDCVRQIAFHGRGGLLLSMSNDASMKLWSLKSCAGSVGNSVVDVEPIITYRGHSGPVLCGGIHEGEGLCFSGGMDGTVRLWALPPASHDLYDSPPIGLREGILCLQGHTDAVWDIVSHPRERLLLSASSDATIRGWSLPDGTPCGPCNGFMLSPPAVSKATGSGRSGAGASALVPTSICIVACDDTKLAAAYSNNLVALMDLQTGRPALIADPADKDWALPRPPLAEGVGMAAGGWLQGLAAERPPRPAAQPNRIAAHPLLPVVVTAHEDSAVRLLDIRTGRGAALAANAHGGAAVTGLDLHPSGLFAATAAADGEVRTWDLRQRAVLGRVPGAHSPRDGEGACCVAFHPSRPLLASAGADARVVLMRLAD